MLFNLLLIAAGIAFLYYGADLLLKGSTGLAFSFGIRPAVVGLTVVAYGTSMPELVVSLSAAASGSAGLASGNIVGSNICNIGLIVGLTALILPLDVDKGLLKRDAPFTLIVSVLFYLACLDGSFSRLEGALFFAGLAVYTYLNLRKKTPGGEDTEKPGAGKRLRQLLLVVAGIAGLVFGAQLLVKGAVSVAHAAGISDAIIGLSLVAFGTSLPELASSLVAAFRGNPDIGLGNILGSNLFNIMMIGGIVAMIHPLPVPHSILSREMPVMLALTAALIPIMWAGRRISRVEGGLLFAGYAVVMALLFT